MNARAEWFVPGHAQELRVPTTGAGAFDLVKRLRVTFLRVWQQPDASLSPAQWAALLDGARAAKVSVVVIWGASDARYEELRTLLTDERVARHDALFAIDLGEMLSLNDRTLYALRRTSELIRQKAPQVAVTMGGWRSDPTDPATLGVVRSQHPSDLARIVDHLDFVSVLAYRIEVAGSSGMDAAVQSLVDPVAAAAKGRPVIVSEYGSPAARATDIGLSGTPEEAAAALTAFLRSAVRHSRDQRAFRGAWAFALLDDGSAPLRGWGMYAEGGEKRTPSGAALRSQTEGQTSR